MKTENLVICKNCGATYDSTKNNRICPYWGMEDSDVLIEETKEYINKVRGQAEGYKKLPDIIAWVMRILATVLVIFFAVRAFSSVANTKKVTEEKIEQDNSDELARLDKLQEELDKAYEARDPERIDELYWENFDDIIQRRFDKYTDYMFNAQGYEENPEEEKVIDTYDLKAEHSEEETAQMRRKMNDYLFGASVILNTCYSARELKYINGGREEYEYYNDLVSNRLIDKYHFTEEQVDEIRAICTNRDNMYTMREELYAYVDIMWENIANEM